MLNRTGRAIALYKQEQCFWRGRWETEDEPYWVISSVEPPLLVERKIVVQDNLPIVKTKLSAPPAEGYVITSEEYVMAWRDLTPLEQQALSGKDWAVIYRTIFLIPEELVFKREEAVGYLGFRAIYSDKNDRHDKSSLES